MFGEHLVRNLDRVVLKQFQRQLLCQHDVWHGKRPFRHEAKDAYTLTCGVEFFDVQLSAMMDAIPDAGGTADNIEEAAPIVVFTLSGGKILP